MSGGEAAAPPRTLAPNAELPPHEWRERAEAHRERARRWTLPHRSRRERGEAHPVEDFLFEYYNLAPGKLERWHPGLGVRLVDAPEYARLGTYCHDGRAAWADPARLERRLPGLRWTAALLRRTLDRAPRWGCFGLHEWAMVHRTASPRHDLPLRLGADGTDAVVESHQLSCTHVDAFRFFTPSAAPRNDRQLTRADQLQAEQPGCLHVTMDLYRIAFRMLPFIEATIVLDAFELAREVRETDMEASPYDVRGLGLGTVAIETPEGKAEYVRRQRAFADRAEPLRRELLHRVEALLARA